MSRRAGSPMALRLLIASLRARKRSVILACVAVALGSSLVATAVGLRGTRWSFEGQMTAFGPNILIVPSAGSALDVASLASLDRMRGEGMLESYAPFLAVTATVHGHEIAVTGTRFAQARQLHAGWGIEGTWPPDSLSALVGADLAARLRLREGMDIELRGQHGRASVRVAGLLKTGTGEESQVVVDLSVAQVLVGDPARLSFVQARARTSRELPGVVERLANAIPDADVRTPFLVARAEEQVLARLERLLALVAALVLVMSTLTVHATMAGSVVERRREVGVLKALGASARTITRLFAAEAAVIGVAGALVGAGLGLVFTEAIAYQVFSAFVLPEAAAILIAFVVGLGVSVLASLGPVRHATRIAAVAVLKGE